MAWAGGGGEVEGLRSVRDKCRQHGSRGGCGRVAWSVELRAGDLSGDWLGCDCADQEMGYNIVTYVMFGNKN